MQHVILLNATWTDLQQRQRHQVHHIVCKCSTTSNAETTSNSFRHNSKLSSDSRRNMKLSSSLVSDCESYMPTGTANLITTLRVNLHQITHSTGQHYVFPHATICHVARKHNFQVWTCSILFQCELCWRTMIIKLQKLRTCLHNFMGVHCTFHTVYMIMCTDVVWPPSFDMGTLSASELVLIRAKHELSRFCICIIPKDIHSEVIFSRKLASMPPFCSSY